LGVVSALKCNIIFFFKKGSDLPENSFCHLSLAEYWIRFIFIIKPGCNEEVAFISISTPFFDTNPGPGYY
jgi:hypothetical protein